MFMACYYAKIHSNSSTLQYSNVALGNPDRNGALNGRTYGKIIDFWGSSNHGGFPKGLEGALLIDQLVACIATGTPQRQR